MATNRGDDNDDDEKKRINGNGSREWLFKIDDNDYKELLLLVFFGQIALPNLKEFFSDAFYGFNVYERYWHLLKWIIESVPKFKHTFRGNHGVHKNDNDHFWMNYIRWIYY